MRDGRGPGGRAPLKNRMKVETDLRSEISGFDEGEERYVVRCDVIRSRMHYGNEENHAFGIRDERGGEGLARIFHRGAQAGRVGGAEAGIEQRPAD